MNALQSTANHNVPAPGLTSNGRRSTPKVPLDGQLLKLTQKEFDLLALLVQRASDHGT